MARTPSTMLALGTSAPDFSLLEPLSGKQVAKQDFAGQPLLVMFICNHCPYVVHIQAALVSLAREYQQRGVAVVAINANDIDHYPDDSPAQMVVEAQRLGYSFPYLFDETQSVAKAYQAACTPDFFLFDAAHYLVYRGQFDDARPRNTIPVTGQDLKQALDALLSDQPQQLDQRASLGCNIKWRVGNEPDYYATS